MVMHQEIKVLIIEDEIIWTENLSATLFDLGFTIAGIAANFEEAVLLINKTDFDIALVDINLNHKNSGIELGNMLNTYYKKPYIFVTASMESHSMDEAVRARPSAYLTKPVHRKSLVANIHSAIYNFNNNHSPVYAALQLPSDMFFVKNGSKYKQLLWGKIVHARSDKNYTIIFNCADGNEYYIRSTLAKTLSHIIPQHLQASFAQVNRAEAVQVTYINEVVENEVRTNYKTLTVTESYIASLKEKMKIVV